MKPIFDPVFDSGVVAQGDGFILVPAWRDVKCVQLGFTLAV